VIRIPDVELAVDVDKGEATFEYDPTTLCAERLKQMSKTAVASRTCRTAAEELQMLKQTDGIFGIVPSPTRPRTNSTVEIPVEGLDCKACNFAATESITKLTAWIAPRHFKRLVTLDRSAKPSAPLGGRAKKTRVRRKAKTPVT